MRYVQFFLILGILLITEFAHAQNIPGYLGKRFAFGYTAVMMPGIGKNPGVNTPYVSYRNGGSLIWNYQHRVTTEYVVAKKWSLTGEIMASNVAFDLDHRNAFGSTIPANQWMRSNVTGFMIGTRQYRKHLAPLSRFLGYKVGYYSVRTEPYTVSRDFYESNRPQTELTFSEIQTGTAVVGFSVGTNRVIRDRALLSFSFDLSILMRGRKYSNSILGQNSEYYELDYDRPDSRANVEIFENLALGRVFAESLFNFSVGLSFLP